ncbi:hypothetical protein [Zoogloea sp.]|uniref:hypothetical protein n=1 Tax=Zoogloea sp. TaxID=49181 RepID=UPI001AC9C1E6|nr:hypothetical protein [Zoogloea sp.]MBN8284689.1 hypothetical protein [Zoogloea sp.]
MNDPHQPSVAHNAEITPKNPDPGGMPKSTRRARIWELPRSIQAPLLGISVSLGNLASIAARHGLALRTNESDLLGTMLSQLDVRNSVSDAVQHHLEKTHRIWIDRFARADDEAEVLARWRICIDQGQVGGPLWAACSHKRISETGLQRIHADFHVLYCRNDLLCAVDTKRLAYLEVEINRLRDELRKLHIRHAGDMDALRQELTTRAKKTPGANPTAEGVRTFSRRSGTAGSSAALPYR